MKKNVFIVKKVWDEQILHIIKNCDEISKKIKQLFYELVKFIEDYLKFNYRKL